MAGQLSPDGNYYWDGVRWANAVSPDGGWRWNGQSWQPATGVPGARPRTSSRLALIIAAGVIAALLLTGGAFFGISRVLTAEQQQLQASFGPACGQNGTAGHAVAEGDTVCGRRLGPSVTAADCTTGGLPADLVAEHIPPGATDWTPADVGMDGQGCELKAADGEIVAVDSSGVETPDITLIADFVPVEFAGAIGLRLACSENTSCVDIALYSDGTYELDEGTSDGGWKTLTSGPAIFGHVRPAAQNRLILRFAGGSVSVFLNGYEITHANPDLSQETGYIGFYVDNQDSTQTAHVQLVRMYGFES